MVSFSTTPQNLHIHVQIREKEIKNVCNLLPNSTISFVSTPPNKCRNSLLLVSSVLRYPVKSTLGTIASSTRSGQIIWCPSASVIEGALGDPGVGGNSLVISSLLPPWNMLGTRAHGIPHVDAVADDDVAVVFVVVLLFSASAASKDNVACENDWLEGDAGVEEGVMVARDASQTSNGVMDVDWVNEVWSFSGVLDNMTMECFSLLLLAGSGEGMS